MLKGDRCEAHGSDMRVHIEATNYHAYPDVSVVCPPVQGQSEYVIANPVLVVEVLSPSTADFDRGTKFDHYRKIPSLREYLLFWQDLPRVEQHTRTDDGNWLLRDIVGIDQTIHFVSIDKHLHLRDAYARVAFN